MWNTSGQRWEKPLDESLAMCSLRKLRSWGQSVGIVTEYPLASITAQSTGAVKYADRISADG